MFCVQVQAAETEIKDLQLEFGLEKMDYLSTIRRQERDLSSASSCWVRCNPSSGATATTATSKG